ncbi:unnamed protein product [Psylliodes chrysocephalus]|uniref:Myb/SANT-like DNA-binding domain-containing protein n=1 Tax=Psylliodes chrysocephalus TaxID=3402493 RepID=A0A9P0GGY2_9CUCU|nr:unnamed protein product [Psylliodes chrysocephala]
MSELIETDNGEYLWYNPETKQYHVVEVAEHPQKSDEHTVSWDKSETTKLLDEHTEKPSTSKAASWDKSETTKLLDLCIEYKEQLFSPKYKKIEIYKIISKKLNENGYSFTENQCFGRMKTLLSKYKEIKDHNSKTGNDPKTWMYFNMVANYVGDRPGISPVAGCSSLSAAKRPAELSTNKENKRPKTKFSPQKEMLKWLKDYKEDIADRENKKLKIMEKQHDDNQKVLTEILSRLKNKQ